MTDRILTETDLDEMEHYANGNLVLPGCYQREDVREIIASHRLLAELVKQYERKDYGD